MIKIYSYHCDAPSDDSAIHNILRAAHRYKNTLTQVERNRRILRAATQRIYSPDLVAAEAEVERLDAEIEALMEATKDERKGSRRGTASPQKAEIAALKASRKEAYARQKAARDLLKSDGRYKADEHAINTAANDAVKAERAVCGVYWGTYLLVEEEMDAAKKQPGEGPRFQRFDGTGRIGIQLQGGLTVDEALSCEDTRLRIDVHPMRDPSTRRGQRQWANVKIRVGSEGRAPVWLELEVLLHRPLPSDAVIKWCWLLRTRRGTKWIYALQFTLDTAIERRTHAAGGAVAVDLGWRAVNGLRVAYWIGSDGAHGEISVPPEALRAITRPDELRATRDGNFDLARARLVAWLEGRHVPEWLANAAQTLAQWKAPARLAALVVRWREQRFDGDAEIYALLDAWRQQDKHLLEWEANERSTGLGRRAEHYHVWAVQMARRYRTVVLEDFDLRTFARKSPVEEAGAGEGRWVRLSQRLAAPSELRRSIVEVFADVKKVDAKDTTRTCHCCGVVEVWDQAKYIMHTCGACGATWDQDYNACVNLLRAVGCSPLGLDGGEVAQSGDLGIARSEARSPTLAE